MWHKNNILSIEVLSIQDKQADVKYSERNYWGMKDIKMGSLWCVGKAMCLVLFRLHAPLKWFKNPYLQNGSLWTDLHRNTPPFLKLQI